MVLDFCDKEAHSAKEILDYLDVSYQSKNIHRYILVLVEQDRLVPEDPNKKRNVRYMFLSNDLAGYYNAHSQNAHPGDERRRGVNRGILIAVRPSCRPGPLHTGN